MIKVPARFRRPSIAVIMQVQASGNLSLANTLWRFRESRATRYANKSIRNQRQRRLQARRLQKFPA